MAPVPAQHDKTTKTDKANKPFLITGAKTLGVAISFQNEIDRGKSDAAAGSLSQPSRGLCCLRGSLDYVSILCVNP